VGWQLAEVEAAAVNEGWVIQDSDNEGNGSGGGCKWTKTRRSRRPRRTRAMARMGMTMEAGKVEIIAESMQIVRMSQLRFTGVIVKSLA
jgi:hypothetical protein